MTTPLPPRSFYSGSEGGGLARAGLVFGQGHGGGGEGKRHCLFEGVAIFGLGAGGDGRGVGGGHGEAEA